MNETTMTIVGNVLNEPECRLLEQSQQLVTHFKVAATSRRYDRSQERWVDGDTLRLRVTCWRQLADNVARSVRIGDPVVVTGRLSSNTWEDENHVKRTSYELEAATVGHDLTRGRAKFARVRATTSTSAIDDELAETRIAGKPSSAVTSINGLPRRRDYDSELGGFVTTIGAHPDATRDPFAEDVLRELDEAVSAAFDSALTADAVKEAEHDAAVDFAARAVEYVRSQTPQPNTSGPNLAGASGGGSGGAPGGETDEWSGRASGDGSGEGRDENSGENAGEDTDDTEGFDGGESTEGTGGHDGVEVAAEGAGEITGVGASNRRKRSRTSRVPVGV